MNVSVLFCHYKVQIQSRMTQSLDIFMYYIFDHYMIHQLADPIPIQLLNITKRAPDGSRFFGSVLSNSSGARVTKRRVKI